MDHLPIIFCFDAKFATYAAVAIYSAAANSHTPLHVHCLVPASDLRDIAVIDALKDKLIDHRFDVIGVDDQSFRGWKEVDHFTRANYLRLLIPDVITESKIIYLDSDLIVLGDLSELFASLEEGDPSLLAGVFDPVATPRSRMPLAKDDTYISSGVLVMKLKQLRDDSFFSKCSAIYSSHSELVTFADQCIINKYAEHRKKRLDPKWNRQVFLHAITPEEWIDDRAGSAIIHFVGPTKPWHVAPNTFAASLWFEYSGRLNALLGRTGLQDGLPMSRNALCPCGSGKRFKHCHGAL